MMCTRLSHISTAYLSRLIFSLSLRSCFARGSAAPPPFSMNLSRPMAAVGLRFCNHAHA